MSPEQAAGKELDGRTDLFSFGAVFYEMAISSLPFRGESSALIFNAILERVPVPPLRLNPELPMQAQEIITKALEKDRNLRYQSAVEMRADLQRLKRQRDGMPQLASMPGRKGRRLLWSCGNVAAVVLIAVHYSYSISVDCAKSSRLRGARLKSVPSPCFRLSMPVAIPALNI
jgi:serine/threonine protein kinase